MVKTPIPPGPGSNGPYKGHYPANVDRDVFLACAEGDSVNVRTFEALHTSITLAGLYDLIEMQEAQRSWNAAMLANIRHAEGTT